MFVKDLQSGIVHNIDENGLKAFNFQRSKSKKEKMLTQELNDVKVELSEIRELLKHFINKEVR